jgi:hypothetical protein
MTYYTNATERGTRVSHTERHTIRSLLHLMGVAGHAHSCAFPGTGTYSNRCWIRPTLFGRLALVVLTAVLTLALLAPGTASAAFTRPFLCRITGPFTEPSGVAVNAADHLWVSESGPGKLDEFNSAYSSCGEFLSPTLKIEGLTFPSNLAIERSADHFYVTGAGRESEPYVEVFDSTGKLLKRSEKFGAAVHVAVDNSAEPLVDPSAGAVYVAHTNPNPPPKSGGDGLPAGIEKFNASGTPVNFTGFAPSYIEGNQITGTPNGSFTSFNRPEALAVDSLGNIYAVNDLAANDSYNHAGGVDEYSPNGVFVRAFTGEETPGLGESHEREGFGGVLEGVAVDPVNGHVLVSVSNLSRKEGAVDEFDSSGHFLNQITETEIEVSPGVRQHSRLHSARETTVDSHGDLYVVDNVFGGEHAVDVYGAGHFLPSLKLAEATERRPTSAVVNGSVNPEGLPLSDCHFEFVTEAAFKVTVFSDLSSGGKAPCVPAPGSMPVDSRYHLVQAELIGLTSGTTYRYRLVATSSGALGGIGASGALAFTAPHAPAIDSTSATNPSSAFVDLRAQINPLGANTTYHFEYSSDGVNWVKAPIPDADIGSGGPTGGADAAVLQQIGGLAPGTTYHFRVIAGNEIGVTAGPDRTFTTLAQVGPGLPDHRAYELLTPPNKGSAEDMFATPEVERNKFENNDVGFPSESGEGFLLETRAAFGMSSGTFPASGHNAYVFSRTGAGWQTIPLASSSLGVQSLDAPVFDTSDLSQVGIDDVVGSESSTAGAHRVSLIGPSGGPSYTEIHSDAELSEETGMVGASHDLSRVVLESEGHTLAPGAESQDPGSHALYEWASGELTLVNVNSEGSLLNRCGALLGQSILAGTRHDAVSYDGSNVFFTAPDPYAQNKGAGCWNGAIFNVPQLYMRSGGLTTKLSAPEKGVSEKGKEPMQHPAVYVGASKDGSKVFFVTETELTQDAAELELHDPELYQYDTTDEKLTRISAGEPGSPARAPGSSGASVFTVPAVSAKGSAVYFTAYGRLTSSAPAVSGEQVNLYRYDTTTGAAVYVTTVSKRDYPSTAVGGWWAAATGLPAEVALATNANWYTTADGRYLLFASENELTGYSTAAASPGDCPTLDIQNSAHTGHCDEVYRYDSANGGSLTCVSCNPSGAPPESDAFFGHSAGLSTPAAGPVSAISEDGSYVFFDTADGLVPNDENKTLDVYEWHEGRISLISSGQDSAPSFLLGASPDGRDVFFGTHARLVRQDVDTAGDVYDARIGGGFGVSTGAGPCEGDACQNPPAAPIDVTPGSLTFSGAGNVPGEVKTQVTPKVKPTNAQKLANALRACRKKPERQRKKCKSQARKRYAKKANKSTRARHAKTSGRAGKVSP